MTQNNISRFFLGANTPKGFRSLFSEACPVDEGWNVFAIKGGPGTGKSTLMRRVVQEAVTRGFECEQIYCSSDPNSLDGVIIPAICTAIFDGTAPHVIEPVYPGACQHIVDIGIAWSKSRLRAQREKIIACSARCSEHHAQAVRFLACADAFRRNTALVSGAGLADNRIVSTAERLCTKNCGKVHSRKGKVNVRMLSAVTPDGVVTFSDTIESRCKRIIPIIDRWYYPANCLMTALSGLLTDNGHTITVCLCSQAENAIEHIIVDDAEIAFTVCNDVHGAVKSTERAVHTERFLSADVIAENKQRFSFNRKNINSFIELAGKEMKLAKAVHDKLEECYISAMNFDAVQDISDRVCRDIFASGI